MVTKNSPYTNTSKPRVQYAGSPETLDHRSKAILTIDRKINPKDIFVFDGARYDKSVLIRLLGHMPSIFAKENDRVKSMVIGKEVTRYSRTELLGYSNLPQRAEAFIIVSIVGGNLVPVLVPDSVDDKPITEVRLASKQCFKRALV